MGEEIGEEGVRMKVKMSVLYRMKINLKKGKMMHRLTYGPGVSYGMDDRPDDASSELSSAVNAWGVGVASSTP